MRGNLEESLICRVDLAKQRNVPFHRYDCSRDRLHDGSKHSEPVLEGGCCDVFDDQVATGPFSTGPLLRQSLAYRRDENDGSVRFLEVENGLDAVKLRLP